MLTNFGVQVMKYLDAALCYILAGMAKEKSYCEVSQNCTYYKQTLDLIKYVSSKLENAQSHSQNGSMNTKLYVLSLRCQSLLYLKLFHLRIEEVREIEKSLLQIEKQKNNDRGMQSTPVAVLSQQSTGHFNGHTTSSMHSISSVESQSSGSSSCKTDSVISNPVLSGHLQASGHCDAVNVPHSRCNMIQHQNTYFRNLFLCHELWEQADIHISHVSCKEFFKLLESKCGRLTLHSTFPKLVQYIRKGLGMLKEET